MLPLWEPTPEREVGTKVQASNQGKDPKSLLSCCVGGVQYCMCVCQLVMLDDREHPGMGVSLCMCESESGRDLLWNTTLKPPVKKR